MQRTDFGEVLKCGGGVDEPALQRDPDKLDFIDREPRLQAGAAQFAQEVLGEGAAGEGDAAIIAAPAELQ